MTSFIPLTKNRRMLLFAIMQNTFTKTLFSQFLSRNTISIWQLKSAMNIFIPQNGVTEKMNYEKYLPKIENKRMGS